MKDLKYFVTTIALVFDLCVLIAVVLSLLLTGDALTLINALRDLIPNYFTAAAIYARLAKYKRTLL